MFRFFLDKESGRNLKDGLPYFAAGIIDGDFRKDGKPSVSGKDFAVLFVDPWGGVQCEWRAEDEIQIFEVDEDDFENLKDAIKALNV